MPPRRAGTRAARTVRTRRRREALDEIGLRTWQSDDTPSKNAETDSGVLRKVGEQARKDTVHRPGDLRRRELRGVADAALAPGIQFELLEDRVAPDDGIHGQVRHRTRQTHIKREQFEESPVAISGKGEFLGRDDE